MRRTHPRPAAPGAVARPLARGLLQSLPMLVLGLVLALAIGITLGLLGGGGSILSVPILRYVVGEEAHVAVAMSLFVVALTSLAALVPHARAGRVRWQLGLRFGLASMVGAYVGGRLGKLVPPTLLLVLFAIVMVVAAVAMLRRRSSSATPPEPRTGMVAGVLQGLAVGAVTGLVGAGGGFLVVPALVLLGGLPMLTAVGTSLLVLAMNASAGFIGHLADTTLDWPVLAGVTAAALAGSLVGARAIGRVSPDRLRKAFGWLVIAMGLVMLAQELPALARSTPDAPTTAAARLSHAR